MAQICSSCGTSVNDGTAFCPSCGKAIQTGGSTGNFKNASQNINDTFKKITDTDDMTGDFDRADIEANKVLALFSYLGFLFLIPLLGAPNSRFAKFHANQGIIFFIFCLIFSIIIGVVSTILGFIPFVGWIFSLILWLLELLPMAFMIMGVINAVSGKAKELPIIGKFRILK